MNVDYVQHRVFQDPPQELDETWVSGVLIGGVASPYDDVALAHAYLRAAASLVDQALDSKQPYELAFPIFYL
ncbi:MAG: hypothetical protein QOF51_3691, partial [Chloroflexota bacterium]|nr:hypothetical protein [Chloroflexota bacterium]